MDEQFDDKLKSRITEVFDHYEFPPADEAWLELRKKFPVKEERKVAWLWWSSAAAILLVFLGLGIWFNNKQQITTNVAGNPGKGQNHANSPDSLKQQPKGQNNIAVTPPEQPQVINPANTKPIDTVGEKLKNTESENNKHYTAGLKKSPVNKPAPVINQTPVVPDNGLNNTIAVTKPIVKKHEPTITAHPPVTNSTVPPVARPTPNQQVIVGNLPNSNQNPAVIMPQQVAVSTIPPINTNAGGDVPAVESKPGSVVTKPGAKTVQDLFNETKPPQVAQQKAEKKALKKVNFSVYAATYFNYAEGSSNQVNAGAGFTSDIRLGKRVKLSTGVMLAQNTLSYAAGAPPVNTNSRTFADAIPSITQSGLFNPTASVAELKGSNASLVGLDIPINIKFEFNPDKTDTYISAGLSSGTFIDERYTYRYAYHNNSLGYSSVTTTENQTTSQSFNSFYFGKTLNVSFGTGFPIGKTNRLVIEPFLKYPLGGMGAQSIHFGAGGINLKFNFKATKK